MKHSNIGRWRGNILATAMTLMSAVMMMAAPSAWAESSFEALYLSATGWEEPGAVYPMTLNYSVDATEVAGATIEMTLSPYTSFDSAAPAPDSVAGNTLTWNFDAGNSGKIIVRARAFDLIQEPTMVWRDISASATMSFNAPSTTPPIASTTLGPKALKDHDTARFGVRKFPLVMVEYQDITHCTGEGEPFPECTGDHTAVKLDHAVNSRTSGESMWQLFQEMSFGQLSPEGQVGPMPNTPDTAYDPSYNYKWSSLDPAGTCAGATTAPPTGEGAPLSPRGRIEDGWYVLPGTQNYYGQDSTGHGLVGALTGVGLLFGIDDACSPTGALAYDAAAIADQDLDYNEFDSDRDGLVDFMNVAFAGDGGNGNLNPTGTNNVWPHKSDLQYYYMDEQGRRGYVSNDQLRNHEDQLMFWTNAERTDMTTSDTGIPVFVRVGPYNVNPESAIDAVSVVAHEYGHSLGLPDYYSTGGRETFGSWELMASDHFQFMTVFNRQELGWIVPRPATDGVHTLKESKIDTGTIEWTTEDGTPYELSGPGIHNADALKVDLPKVLVIDEVPSGTQAWHSGSGNEFGCSPEAGHNFDVYLPDLAYYGDASNVTLSFESLYEIEWDWDFAFLLVSTDGINWQALPSLENTTLDGFNPNGWECYDRYGHGITGASRVATQERNLLTNSNRATGSMPTPEWMTDRFDLSAFAGQDIIIRFTYFTDPAVAFRGWFIDDIKVEADGETVYASDFEDHEDGRLFSHGWAHVNTSTGRDVDHAYYIEVRDRVSNDFDSKGQSDRGPPTWEPGVAILYTDENHGYGNTGVDNPPAQTIVDSVPEPGNDTPNLDDAAFTAAAGRNVFDACTHVDNYDNTAGDHPDGYWKLPEGLRMTVDALTVVGPQAAVSNAANAVLTVDAYPTCLDLEAPELALGADYGNPDTDGAYTLDWTLSANAIGPNVLQEATVLADLFSDDAESGLGATWTTEMYDSCGPDPIGMAPWTTNTGKWESEVQSFFATTTDAVYGATCADYHSVMQTASAVSIPADGGTVLTFFDAIGGELDDRGAVEVSSDSGQTWEEVYATSGPLFLDENATFIADTSLKYKEIDLSEFAGQNVLIRFNYSVGASNYIAYAPIGWWVDDITISTANWEDIAEVGSTSYLRDGRTNGTYHYRVKTRYPGSPVAVDSPWSNIVTANVTGVMNRAPVANDDAETTDYQTAVTIDVLTNDTDADGDSLSVESVTQGMSGSVSNNGNNVTYTPNPGFVGTDTFTYTANDGSNDSNSATVTVTVLGPDNRKPEAGDDMAGTEFESAVTVDVLVNDSDPDGDNLSVATVGTAANGTVVNNTTDVTYTPNNGFSGADSFTYTVSDGNGGSDEATVTVTVAEQGNRQPGAMDDNASTDQDTPVAIDVLANDSDPDSDPLTIVDVSDPANGSVTNNSGKTVTYTPDPGFFGTDTFTYTVADGRSGEDTATVTVTVYETGTNHAPEAKNDKAKTPKNTEIVIYVTANDKDSDGDVLTVDSFTQGEHGFVSPVGDDALRYVPDQDYVGNDAFTYTVSDGRGGFDTANVKVTVTQKDKDDDGSSDDNSSYDDGNNDDNSSDDGSSSDTGSMYADSDGDGEPNETDTDDDNDGKSDDSDSDDDNDGYEDEIDSPGLDKKQSQSSAAPAYGSVSYPLEIDASTASIFVMAKGAGSEMLQMQIVDSAGLPVGASISGIGQLTSFAQTFLMGTYTITIINPTAIDIEFDYVTVTQHF